MKTDEEIKQTDPELYKVAREGGTEAPFAGKYVDEHTEGVYKCAICGNELFSSDTKFDSGTGWPSFTEPKNLENIELKEDGNRTEVVCKNCGAHLGHVFDDLPAGRQVALGKNARRYCINSVCLDLQQK